MDGVRGGILGDDSVAYEFNCGVGPLLNCGQSFVGLRYGIVVRIQADDPIDYRIDPFVQVTASPTAEIKQVD